MRSSPYQRGGKCNYQGADTHQGHGGTGYQLEKKIKRMERVCFLSHARGREPYVKLPRRYRKTGNSGLESQDRRILDVNRVAKRSGTALTIEMNGSIAIFMHLAASCNHIQQSVEDSTRLSSQLRT